MGRVAHFLSEDVTWVNDSWNMEHLDLLVVVAFPNLVFTEVEMLDSFRGDFGRPLDAGLIVIVDRCTVEGIEHSKILCTKANGLEICDTFVCGDNFSFT